MTTKKQFSAEFKQDAVNYYYSSGKSSADVAKELKIGKSTLDKWIHNAKNNSGTVSHRGSGNYSSDIEKENARLKNLSQSTTNGTNHTDSLCVFWYLLYFVLFIC